MRINVQLVPNIYSTFIVNSLWKGNRSKNILRFLVLSCSCPSVAISCARTKPKRRPQISVARRTAANAGKLTLTSLKCSIKPPPPAGQENRFQTYSLLTRTCNIFRMDFSIETSLPTCEPRYAATLTSRCCRCNRSLNIMASESASSPKYGLVGSPSV